ncbi:hypothetical protein BJ912DRAFT_969724, partial [Pholiota molesta]
MLHRSATGLGSPIIRLPYDILQEIFAHCLPQYPLLRRQPSTTTAPILLCRICSSWRRLVLASPTLWKHLSYGFSDVDESVPAVDSDSGSFKFGRRIQFLEREIEFIQWWRMRQGQIAPFLSFDIEECDCRSLDLKLTSDSMPFLLEYISSAQYLELGLFFWDLIQQTIQAGHQLVFPNLHTVLLERTYSSKDSQAFYRIQSDLPAHAFPTLRRLSISEVAPANDFAIPAHWSTLTHISLNSISISLDFWLSFIRAVPNIQWGSFAIATGALSGVPRPSPPLCTLRELDTLSVYVSARLARSDVFPL